MLTIKEMRYIDSLSNSSSMAEAAARSGVTQSAISQALAGIEAKLGLQLFVRGSNTVVPTRFGLAVVHRARLILSELVRLDDDLEALTREHLGTVRFGVGPTLANLVLAESLKLFGLKNIGSVPRFRIKFWEDCERALLEGDLELFVGGFPRETRDVKFEFEPFYRDKVIAVSRNDHPLRGRPSVTITDMIAYPVLANDTRHFTIWRALQNVTDFELFNRNVPASVMQNPFEMLELVRSTDYVLLTCEHNWRKVQADFPELSMLRITDLRGEANMYFVRRANTELSEPARVIVDAMKQVATGLGVTILG